MRLLLMLLFSVFATSFNAPVAADDRLVRLSAPEELVESGLLKYMLPRFTLKTQVRVQIVKSGGEAEAALGSTGVPVFSDDENTWFLSVLSPEHPGTAKFADWVTSEVGQRAITGFTIDGRNAYSLPTQADARREEVVFSGNAAAGRQLSVLHCGRCHVSTADNAMRGIGSTPSFFVLRALEDWDYRFSAFYTLNPHPAFTQVKDVTDPFPEDRPPPIVPVELTLDDLDAILSYVSMLPPTDLGAPLKFQ